MHYFKYSTIVLYYIVISDSGIFSVITIAIVYKAKK